MNRDDFISLLARAVREDWIDIQDAEALLAAFDDGHIDTALLPLPLKEALAQENDELLLGFIRRSKPSVTLDALQQRFMDELRAIAPTATTDLAHWQRSVRQKIQDHMLLQASLGASGRMLSPGEMRALGERLREQFAYLSRFADEIAARALNGSPLSEKQIAVRSALYTGAGRAEYFRAAEGQFEDGWVADYHSIDDGGTCDPCISAEQGGPYPVGGGPYPGDVCLGRGYCRCYRTARYAPDEAATVRGA